MRSGEAIGRMREVADLLKDEGRYREAFTLYDELYRQFWGLFGTAQARLVQEGGLPPLRPWDPSGRRVWHVEAVVNILCARAYGMTLSVTLGHLAGVISGHLQCVCASAEVGSSISKEQVLLEVAVGQLLIETPRQPRRIAPLFALVTAVVDRDHRLRWIRLNIPRYQLERSIEERVRTDTDAGGRALAGLLAEYLTSTGDTSSEFSRSILRHARPHSNSYGDREARGRPRPGRARENAPPFDPAIASEAEKKAHYGRIFGLQGDVTRGEVRAKYLHSVALYHPDKVQHLGPELRELAENKTKEINAAYDWFKRTYNL